MSGANIRAATPSDAVAIAAIYAHYVATGTATFELDAPDAAEVVFRMNDIAALGLPYLVAELEGTIAGYGYATQFRRRPAYRFTVEDSVYVDSNFAGRGIGRLLLSELIDRCREAGFRQMIAVIAGENPASVALHGALGFAHRGVLKDVGFKFDRWVDVTLMQRAL
jgi:L-amino acid N-acyltransferase YncA